jgi:hypothetical protein
MRRYLLAAALAVAGMVALQESAAGLMIAMRPAPQRAATAEVVVVGKVTAIEKETVDATRFKGDKEKVAYKVAVVKVEKALAGANNLTHIKVGFIPPPPVQPVPPGAPPAAGGLRPAIRPGRPGLQAPELKVGQEMLLFLDRHPSADFYVMPGMSPPVDVSTDAGKKEIEAVKKVTELLADPIKALKSDKADVRGEAATLLVMKYRAYPPFGGEVDQVPVGADESKLILKALAEADWKAVQKAPGATGPMQGFYQLGLTDKDGWKPPAFPPVQPGQPQPDFIGIQKDAFVKWLAGPGKDYQVKKVVPKKQ